MSLTPRQIGVCIAGAILLLAGGWLVLRNQGEEGTYPTAGENIIAFGDSLVEGVGTSPGKDFVSVLAQRLKVPILNAGRSGNTTATALARLERDVLSRDPRIVIILLGGNDALRQIPKTETAQNLAAIIDAIQAQGAAVILLGVRGGIFQDEYREMFDSLARQKRVFYIPNILKGIFGRANLMSDGIHPNDQGHGLIAERIEPILRKIMVQSGYGK